MKSSCLVLFVFACVSFSAAAGDGQKRLQLRVINHKPCNGRPSASERIRFPSIEQAPIQVSPQQGPGCYVISGQVTVSKSVRGVVQIYSETKYGTRTPTEKCRNADRNGCGGVGSCVYCDACNGVKNVTKKTSALVQLETGTGKKFNCNKGLNPGSYSDVRIDFCLPTKEEFLKSQNMDEQFWNQYVSEGRLFFITLYVFNEAVNKLSRSELAQIARKDGDKVIGCHRLVGTVYE